MSEYVSPSPAPSPTLTHGRIVEFRLDSGPKAGQYRPAMVVRVWSNDCAYLQVFTDKVNDGADPWAPLAGGEWVRASCMRGTDLGTWRWPERVEATR